MPRETDTRRAHLVSVLEHLPACLDRILASEAKRRSEFAPVPTVPAIYVLFEGDEPFGLIVERSRDALEQAGGRWRIAGSDDVLAPIPDDVTAVDLLLFDFAFGFDAAAIGDGEHRLCGREHGDAGA